MANIFVSHRSCDAADAERIARELRTHGHNVWLDLWNVRLGDSIVEKMSECVASDGIGHSQIAC